ncbi:hypothetical protein [Candidatus Ichthyocystis sparus]|uniref:hypothetical protein n=1 Tax=Candidatus Ichthyocystis sparus TaxID=1561004 RepID=UPI000AB26351|nr:hypothetical protein [Candidatus Ichthyocystis sparus]
MYPVSVISSAASSDVPESEDDSCGNKEEGGAIRVGVLEGGLQQVDTPVTASAATTSTTVTAAGKGVSTKNKKGKAPAKKCGTAAVFSSEATLDPNLLSSLGVVLSPESAGIIEGLFLEVDALARRIYNGMVRKQLPSDLSDKLSLTGRAIWCRTYREMCEDVFVFMCLGEYHSKHRPGFIRALPRIKVLSDLPDRTAVPLAGCSLLDFLSKLDCAIHSRVECIFNSDWNEVHVSLEEGGLDNVGCKDFVSVLDTAGIPQVALSIVLAGSVITKEINKGTIKSTASGITTAPDPTLSPQSHPELLLSTCSQSESQAGSSSPLGEASATLSELNLLPSVKDSGDGSSPCPVAASGHTASSNVHISVSASTCAGTGTVRAPVWTPPVLEEGDTLLPLSVSVSACAETDVVRSPTSPIFAEDNVIPSSTVLSELDLLSSVRDSSDRSSSDLIALERYTYSYSFSVSKYSETNVVHAPIWMPPVLEKEDAPCSASIPSHVRCVDLLGVKLHPDGKKLVYDLFCNVRVSFMRYLTRSVESYISTALSSELSALGRVIWFKTYKELHLSSFMSRCFCVYHSRYRPAFIRAIANLGILPSIGGSLAGFLSRLDSVVHDLIRAIFISKWDVESDRACYELGYESLSNVVCEDFTRVLDISGIPIVALSVSRKCVKSKRCKVNRSKAPGQRRTVSRGKTLVSSSSSEIESECAASGGSITDPIPSSSLSMQIKPKLSSQLEHESLSKRRLRSETRLRPLLLLEKYYDSSSPRFVKSLSYKEDQPAGLYATGNVFTSDESSSGTTDDSYYYDFGVLAGELSPVLSPPPSVSFAPLSSSPSSASESYTQSDSCDRPDPHYQYETQLGSLLLLKEGYDQGSMSTTATTFVVPPEGAGSSLPLITDAVAVSTVSRDSSSNISNDVLVSVVEDAASAPGLSVGESFSHLSSPSVSPAPLSSFISELGLDADVSSSSTESFVSVREVESSEAGVVSASGVLVGETTHASSSEKPIVPIPVSSSVSTSSIGESSTAASGSSYSYFRGPKKLFIMRELMSEGRGEVPACDIVAAGPSSSAPADIDNVTLVAAATDIASESVDVGVRLAALLNRDLPPSPPPTSESSRSKRGGRGRVSSSHQGGAQRGSGRKRKRTS